MDHDQLIRKIEEIALAFVMIEPTDTFELQTIVEGFYTMLPWAKTHGQPVLEQALIRLTAMMTAELSERSELSASLFEHIGQSIAVIQNHARLTFDFSPARFPFDAERPITAPDQTVSHQTSQTARPSDPLSPEFDTVVCEQSPSQPSGIKHPGELPNHLDLELFAEFLSLQTAILDRMETLVLSIEKTHDPADVNELRHILHTKKGEAGFLNLQDIERLCHATEDLIETDQACHDTDLFFSIVDWLRHAYGWYKGEFNQAPPPVTDLLDALARVNATPCPREASAIPGTLTPSDFPMESHPNGSGASLPSVKNSILVDTERLDKIIDMIGELVIAGSMIMQSAEIKTIQSQELNRNLALMDKITRGLQETGLSLRMVPIRSIFQKVARLVRDISKKSGKTIDFSMSGEDTELDKTLVDKIGEPLLHIIRNAMVHGIEDNETQRVALGKPPRGAIGIKAFHKSGNIQIEISDDGKGLNKAAILKKARESKRITDDTVLSDRDIVNLIFEPGFSTAQAVTDLSGRGVGMGVVKSTIESLRGQVEVRSVEGKGSLFIIRIPLTLAIIDGMIVRIGEERFIIPTLSIITSTRIEPGQVNSVANHGKVVDVLNQLIPYFDLYDLLETQRAHERKEPKLMVVVEGSNRKIALGVDELVGKQQIVIKSLGESLKNVPGISGAAIMPDGKVGLIVDIDRITEVSRMNPSS